MTPLGAAIAQRIAHDGALPVAEFMRLCLDDPEYGYYRTRTPIGAAGDFTTAPEISQVFGELIGLWAAEIWVAMGRPTMLRLVEFGPGRGTLMADALRAVAKVAPDFRAAIDLHLVEINPALRDAQRSALASATPTWHAAFDTVPGGPAIIVANEFFDALPVRQIVRQDHDWRERVVTLDKDRFIFAIGDPVDFQMAGTVPDGTVVETSPAGEALVRRIARRVADSGGAALLVDYGPLARGYGDTLQAVQRQQKVDPLAEPGLADLTAHVDFAGLAAAAKMDGIAVYGPVPQGRFLQRLGVAARAAILLRNATEAQASDIAAAVSRLIDDSQMGTLFKALSIVDSRLPVPPGFDPPC